MYITFDYWSIYFWFYFQFAKENNLLFYETSAKDSANLEKVIKTEIKFCFVYLPKSRFENGTVNKLHPLLLEILIIKISLKIFIVFNLPKIYLYDLVMV